MTLVVSWQNTENVVLSDISIASCVKRTNFCLNLNLKFCILGRVVMLLLFNTLCCAGNVHLQPRKPVASWTASKEVWPAVWGSWFSSSPLQYCVQISGFQRNGMNLSEQLLRMAPKIIKRLEHLSCEDRLKEVGLLSIDKRKLWADIIVAFQYLRRAYRKDGRDSL